MQEELKEAEPSNNSNPQNDALAKVLGKKKNGNYVLTYGLLPNKPESWHPGLSSEEKEKLAAEARQLADEEVKPMREKMEAMEKRLKEMEEEMGRMRSTIESMQSMFSAQQHLPHHLDQS